LLQRFFNWFNRIFGRATDGYLRVSGALIRNRNLPQARSTLEDAAIKWPADVRFAEPLALVYATFGQGQQAVRTLERHLTEHKNDTEALVLGVEWIYQLALAGTFAHTRAEDVKLALDRHVCGDWGDLCQDDWKENELGLAQGHRLFSRYKDRSGALFYIITEHDRSVTTVLLPEDY